MFKNILVLSFLIFITWGLSTSYGQEAETKKKALSELTLEELLEMPVKIGTRGKERTIFESAVPIEIITEEDISKSGLTELTSILQRYIPYINAPRPSITDGSDHVQAFSMHGLGSDQLIVLINGIRKHNTALVHVNSTVFKGSTSNDLNTIPINSIKRIEILRDGSSAQYGSDAIAGIINIILKEQSPANISLSYKKNYEGDGTVYTMSGFGGYHNTIDEFLILGAEIRDRGFTNRSTIRNDLKGRDSIPSILGKRQYLNGDAESRDLSMIYNFAHIIDAEQNIKLTSFGFFNYRNGKSAGYYRYPSSSNVPLLGFNEGFLPYLTPVLNDLSSTIGIESNVSGWRAKTSLTTGRSVIQFNLENSLNSSIGPSSPRSFYCGTLEFQQYLANIDLFNEYDLNFYKSLKIGFGAEIRVENFIEKKGDENSYILGNYKDSILYNGQWIIRNSYPAGAQLFPGFMPENERDKSRNSFSLYLDFESEPIEKFSFDLSGRYENYSDFGVNVNSKLSARFQPIHNFALRTSLGTGFRAPSLGQSYFTAIGTTVQNGILYQAGTYSVEDNIAKELGAQSLKPEKSININLGFAAKPISVFSIDADIYYLYIKDRIVFTGNFNQSTPSEYVKSILQKYNVSGARFFTNAVNTETKGINVQMNYETDLKDFGLIRYKFFVSFNKTKVVGSIKVPENMKQAADVFFDRGQINRYENNQPADVYNLRINYSLKNFDLQAILIRYGSIKYVQDINNPELDQTFRGKLIVDLLFSYNLSQKLKITAGGHNIFDSYPDKWEPGRGDYYLQYYENSPYGYNGGDFYCSVNFIF